jgi:hypothetical protein
VQEGLKPMQINNNSNIQSFLPIVGLKERMESAQVNSTYTTKNYDDKKTGCRLLLAAGQETEPVAINYSSPTLESVLNNYDFKCRDPLIVQTMKKGLMEANTAMSRGPGSRSR